VNAEVATHASELQSIDDAVAAAKNKLLIAQGFEAAAADRARAARALEILGAMRRFNHLRGYGVAPDGRLGRGNPSRGGAVW
jgi:hypothetical protein